MQNSEIINMMDSDSSQTHIIAACQDNTLRLYTSDPFNLITTLKAHTSSVTAAIYISDTKIVSSSINGELIFWRLETQYTPYYTMKMDAAIISISRFNSRQILVAIDNELKLVNIDTYETEPYYTSNSVIMSLDSFNENVVFCTEDGTFCQLKNKDVVCSEKGNFMDAAITESLNLLCVVTVGDKIVLFENGKRIEIDGKGDCVKWSKSGYCFVVGDGIVCKCYGPDSDGKFIEIHVDEIK